MFLTNNSQETLEKLKNLGYYICPCCTFKNVRWIHLFLRDDKIEFHGTGGGCENECEGMCTKKCIECALKESLAFKNRETRVYNELDDLINFIQNNYDRRTN